MKGTVYLVPFGTQRTTDFLFREAIKDISGKDFSEIIYIGPTIQKIRDAQVSFNKLVGLKAYIPPRFYTIKQYVLDVFNQYHSAVKVLPDFFKPLLITQLARKVLQRNAQEQTPSLGYGKIMAKFIRELKQYLPDKTGDDLVDIVKNLITKRRITGIDEREERLTQALKIYQKYNQKLKKMKWVDTEDIFQYAIGFIRNNVTIKTLILDGFFYDLTTLEEQVVAALINKAQKVFALSFYDSRNPDAYALPQEFLVFLRKLNLLEEKTCATGTFSELPEIRQDLPYYVCPSIEEEVEFIAREIKSRAIKNEIDLNKTIVTFSRLDEYENLVRRIFKKYGIPYSISVGKSLSSTQPVIALMELLNMVINDYPRLSVVSCITSPYFRRFSPKLKESINYFSKKAGIFKGFKYWKNLFVSNRKSPKNDPQRTGNSQELNELRQEFADFLKLVSKFSDFAQQKRRLKDFAHNFKKLITQFQWCVGFEDDETIVEIRAMVYDLLGRLEQFENEFGSYLVSITEFQKVLKYYFDQTELLPSPDRYGVLVLPFMDTRGLDCDYLFFGGLSEDKFPGTTYFDPIVPEWFKEELNLPSLKKHLMRTKFHFFRLINTARKQTILTYHNAKEDKLLLPSPFLGDNCQQMPVSDAIFSYEDYQRYLGEQEFYRTGKNLLLETMSSLPNFDADPEALGLVKNRFKNNKEELSFQVTELEKYAICNYQFYLERVLGLELLKEPEYRPDATFWGVIVHEIFCRLYKKGAPSLDELPGKLNKALEATLKDNKIGGLRADIIKKIITDCQNDFLNREQELRDRGFWPYRVEKELSCSLDLDKEEELSCILGKNLIISGKIDRIDVAYNKQCYIFDYKTGQIDNYTLDKIKKGETLQLPLYAFLVKKCLKLDVTNAGIYTLPDCKINWLIKNGSLEEYISAALQTATQLIGEIIQGRFTKTSEKRCYYCQFRFLCPILLGGKKSPKNEEINEKETKQMKDRQNENDQE
ncbi:MAG: PD-(D/E)XK nuclease family protein [candidate division WOR-3 bacterium]